MRALTKQSKLDLSIESKEANFQSKKLNKIRIRMGGFLDQRKQTEAQ